MGAVQGCAYIAITNETLDKRHALEASPQLDGPQFPLVYDTRGLGAAIADNLIISETQWQKIEPRRAFLREAFYIALVTPFRLPDDDRHLITAIQLIRIMALGVAVWVANAYLGISLRDIVLAAFHLGGESH